MAERCGAGHGETHGGKWETPPPTRDRGEWGARVLPAPGPPPCTPVPLPRGQVSPGRGELSHLGGEGGGGIEMYFNFFFFNKIYRDGGVELDLGSGAALNLQNPDVHEC